EWKRKAESDSTSSFVVRSRRGFEGRGVGRIYYRCHRSGVQRKRPGSRRKTKRNITHCSAFINVDFRPSVNEVSVKYCLAHIGHRLDASLLWFGAESKRLVAELIKKGLTTREIKSYCKMKFGSENGGKKKLCSIRQSEISAIAKEYKLRVQRRECAPSMKPSSDAIFKEHAYCLPNTVSFPEVAESGR
ncbi:hypothetical protein OESDEN_12396, partial [Oesophagostomum dentatum]